METSVPLLSDATLRCSGFGAQEYETAPTKTSLRWAPSRRAVRPGLVVRQSASQTSIQANPGSLALITAVPLGTRSIAVGILGATERKVGTPKLLTTVRGDRVKPPLGAPRWTPRNDSDTAALVHTVAPVSTWMLGVIQSQSLLANTPPVCTDTVAPLNVAPDA